MAEGNLALAWEQGASGRGTVVQGDARRPSRLLVTGARDFLSPATDPKLARLPYGAVDLVLLSPPYACDLIEVYKTTRPAGHLKEARNYSGDRRNLGHARGSVGGLAHSGERDSNSYPRPSPTGSSRCSSCARSAATHAMMTLRGSRQNRSPRPVSAIAAGGLSTRHGRTVMLAWRPRRVPRPAALVRERPL